MQLATIPTSRALPTQDPNALRYIFLRGLLRLSAPFSPSIALGLSQGFESSAMMEYILRNQPSGRGFLGRFIDQTFLNQLGWRAIRTRNALVQQHLEQLLVARRKQGLTTHILDIAAGVGQDYLKLLQKLGRDKITLTCQTNDQTVQAKGQQLANALGLTENVTYEMSDATESSALSQIRRPDIVVVAGFYEMLTDDAAVCRSLLGLRALLCAGGILLFTTQVRHPQLELIANVLNDSKGKPWIMRPRPLPRVERWAREAGFSNIESDLEENAIFSVTQCKV